MQKGFTLSELLLSLFIVGVVAVLSVPVLLNNVNNKTFATQIKNMSATIEQLAQDELLTHRTRDLSNTDFADPEKLLSNNHFSIVKSCNTTESLTKCWKTNATGNDKITYKNLNKSNINIEGANTIILKNGVIFRYTTESNDGRTVGLFFMDINGNDKPNIAGRDLFAFWVDRNGNVVDESNAKNLNETLANKINKCKTGLAGECYGALAENNWKMDY